MPVVTADSIVQAQSNKAADLTAKKAGDLAGATVHLFTNPFTPTPSSVKADFTEAAYVGYAAQPVAGWGGNENLPNGAVGTVATTVLEFSGPVGGGGPLIYGAYYLSAGAGTPLIGSYKFDQPIPLGSSTDFLEFVASFLYR